MNKSNIRIRIGEVMVAMVTIKGLSERVGLSIVTLKKHEERGIIPRANFRTRGVTTGISDKGYRLYTTELADAVAKVFREKVSQGKQIPAEVKQELKDLFTKEKQKYAGS